MNSTGVDDCVDKSICNGLFPRNRELYAEDKLGEAGNIIYRLPPLHEVWLDEEEPHQRNKDHIRQRHRNEDLMHECNCSVKKVIPTPLATDLDDVDDVPGAAPISNDSSVDSLLFSHASESEGGIWANNYYDDDTSNTHEGANLVPLDFNRNEGVQPAPKIIQAPKGAPCRTHGKAKEYPPVVWHRGADGKLERVSLSAICKEYKQLNCNMFVLTFGQQDIPPMAQRMSKKQHF